MTPEIFFNVLWPTISGLVIMPLTSWIKKRIVIADWPINVALISVVLNALSIFGLTYVMNLEMSLETAWPYIAAGQAVSQLSHSIKKTKNGE